MSYIQRAEISPPTAVNNTDHKNAVLSSIYTVCHKTASSMYNIVSLRMWIANKECSNAHCFGYPSLGVTVDKYATDSINQSATELRRVRVTKIQLSVACFINGNVSGVFRLFSRYCAIPSVQAVERVSLLRKAEPNGTRYSNQRSIILQLSLSTRLIKGL